MGTVLGREAGRGGHIIWMYVTFTKTFHSVPGFFLNRLDFPVIDQFLPDGELKLERF